MGWLQVLSGWNAQNAWYSVTCLSCYQIWRVSPFFAQKYGYTHFSGELFSLDTLYENWQMMVPQYKSQFTLKPECWNYSFKECVFKPYTIGFLMHCYIFENKMSEKNVIPRPTFSFMWQIQPVSVYTQSANKVNMKQWVCFVYLLCYIPRNGHKSFHKFENYICSCWISK